MHAFLFQDSVKILLFLTGIGDDGDLSGETFVFSLSLEKRKMKRFLCFPPVDLSSSALDQKIQHPIYP